MNINQSLKYINNDKIIKFLKQQNDYYLNTLIDINNEFKVYRDYNYYKIFILLKIKNNNVYFAEFNTSKLPELIYFGVFNNIISNISKDNNIIKTNDNVFISHNETLRDFI